MNEFKHTDNQELSKSKAEGFKNIKPIYDMTKNKAIETWQKNFNLPVKEQNKELKRIENGKKTFDKSDPHQLGNYGEMKTDIELLKNGYIRISKENVSDIKAKTHQGLDGVYYRKGGVPEYLIVDAKYGSSRLGNTLDGKEMSANWIDNRLDKDLGKDKADVIRMEIVNNPENVGAYISRVSSDGKVTFDKLDNNANVIEKDVNFNAKR